MVMNISDAVQVAEKAGLECRRLNHDRQLNIRDKSRIWHSYYPSTGTMVFNHFDDIRKKYQIYNIKLTEDFINKYFVNPDEIQNLFVKEDV